LGYGVCSPNGGTPQWVRLSDGLGVAEPNATLGINHDRSGLIATSAAAGYFSAALTPADAPLLPQRVRLSDGLGVAELDASLGINDDRSGLIATSVAAGYFSAALTPADARLLPKLKCPDARRLLPTKATAWPNDGNQRPERRTRSAELCVFMRCEVFASNA
jgi:hypothetical protein